jgi:uncharacterized membrane protein HdeD (DUF308 family)
MLQMMSPQVIQRNRWMLVLRGVLAIIFGLIALLFPGIALLAFIFVFAIYAIIIGIVTVIVAVGERGALGRWGWVLLEGILSILAGLIAIFFPGETALVLLYIVAAWAIVTGMTEIFTAYAMHPFVSQEWPLVLAGILSVIFGVLLIIYPRAGLLSLLWLVGIYAIVFGILYIIRAFQLRSWPSVPMGDAI